MAVKKDIVFENTIPYTEFFESSFIKLEEEKRKGYLSEDYCYYCYDSKKDDSGKYLNHYVSYARVMPYYLDLLEKRGFSVSRCDSTGSYSIKLYNIELTFLIKNIFRYNAIPLTATNYKGKIPDNVNKCVYLVRDSEDNVVGAYGFSHRVSCCFLIGDKMFPSQEDLDFEAAMFHKGSLRNFGSEDITTIEECIISASRFADFAD